MNWYYVDAGQQAGPVSDEQLDALRASGKLNDETLVWREGMTDWQPLRVVRPAGGAAAQTSAGLQMTGSGPGAVCAECGRMFETSDMIRHGDAYICANCKPIFMQKLAEGAKIETGAINYAGFWIRFAAKVIDGIITNVVTFPLSLISTAMTRNSDSTEAIIGVQLVVIAISIVITAAYNIFFVGKYAATPGKMLLKLKIVTSDFGTVSYARATGRFFAEFLSSMICMIGYIIAGFDDQKRSLHDHICNTRVVHK